ncbi:serine hydrolase [Acuticoccus sediminis]|uniref:hypothetical protein n=1 Tax=Acuticoccus sediminis TaxID=2184697 RepID=UPI001CFCD405|nr:hypothetical protein [Acuticoccus sediminis]
MLLGPALGPASRDILSDWMSRGGVTGALIRDALPADRHVADKSGAGNGYTRSLVAMVTPPDRAPWFVAIYISDTPTDFATRNAELMRIGETVADVLLSR